MDEFMHLLELRMQCGREAIIRGGAAYYRSAYDFSVERAMTKALEIAELSDLGNNKRVTREFCLAVRTRYLMG